MRPLSVPVLFALALLVLVDSASVRSRTNDALDKPAKGSKSSKGSKSAGSAGVHTGVPPKAHINLGQTAVIAPPGEPAAADTHYAVTSKGTFHVPSPLPPVKRLRGYPWRPVSNWYPYHAYLPAYRSTYFYSPWMHDPFGLRPFNHYSHTHTPGSDNPNIRPFNTFRYPWRMPAFPLVGAHGVQQWGYPGYYPGVPSVKGFPGGGFPGVPHPAYPFMTPVSRMLGGNGVRGLYKPYVKKSKGRGE